MKRPRFTIASLLGIVLFLAVGLAALREATNPWDSGVFGLTLVLLLSSVLLSVHRLDERRAYWLGFALFGSVYLALSLIQPVATRLPTTKALTYLDSKVTDRARTWFLTMSTTTPGTSILPAQGIALATGGTITASPSGGLQVWQSTTGATVAGVGGTTENFLQIGHSLLALMLAFFGAHLSRYLHASKQSRQPEQSDSDQVNTTV